ncbi:MAG: peptidoglycan DD-metalloendopeptidase family protein [Alphaproteobacteria bacterium]|nr:peptidoglycan DD-metalloendopeptidase family protein [Alphaproteobacteria bacterium SS10]
MKFRPLPTVSLCCCAVGFAAIGANGLPPGAQAPAEARESVVWDLPEHDEPLAMISRPDVDVTEIGEGPFEVAALHSGQPVDVSFGADFLTDGPSTLSAMAEALTEVLPSLNAQPLGLLDDQVPDILSPDMVVPNAKPTAAETVAALAKNLADNEPGDRLIERAVKVGSGDTLMKLLVGEAVPRQEAHEAIDALREHYNPRRLRVGQTFSVLFEPEMGPQGIKPTFVGLRINPDLDQRVEVSRGDDGGFQAELHERQFEMVSSWAMAKIEGNMMSSGRNAGVPSGVLAEVIRAFSYDVDFQRDLQPGDRFIVQYEQKMYEDGRVTGAGNLRYAALIIGERRLEVFRHQFADGTLEYYNSDGNSVRKALLRTPVEGARISSRYGMRRHPILGYSKMHRGVDFAAPRGTPIYAAGDGVVERSGRFGAYGKYVRVRHGGSMATAYAHMHRIAKGIKPGTRVRQGQIIGYVGSTGRSTGPHLHYEVLVNGSQVNPLSIELPVGKALAGMERQRFDAMAEAVRREAQDVATSRGFGIQLAQVAE